MSTEADDVELDPVILRRTNLPGLFLTWVGILNVFAGLLLVRAGIGTWKMTPEEFRDQQRQTAEQVRNLGFGNSEEARQLLDIPAEQLQAGQLWTYFLSAAVALAAGFVITYAGFNLRVLNSYRLALGGAILAMVPVVSPLGCVGIGQVVGVWALVVLLDRDVRAAFP